MLLPKFLYILWEFMGQLVVAVLEEVACTACATKLLIIVWNISGCSKVYIICTMGKRPLVKGKEFCIMVWVWKNHLCDTCLDICILMTGNLLCRCQLFYEKKKNFMTPMASNRVSLFHIPTFSSQPFLKLRLPE